MPLMVARLRKSKAWVKAKRNPALGFYMINLWTAAWHEQPAGSLEDDDDVLADAAMCDPAKWAKVREDALRGWVKCDDGRLYHPVVCEQVLNSWKSKLERAEKNAHESERKRLEREERAGHFATLKAAGIHRPWNAPLSELRELVRNLSAGQASDGPETVRNQSRLGEGQGQGERQGQGEERSSAPGGAGGTPPPARRKVDPESAQLWRELKTLFVEMDAAKDVKAAGVLLGALTAKYGANVFKAAGRALLDVRPVPGEPHTYLVSLCEKAVGNRPGLNRQEQLEAQNLAAAAAFAGATT